MSTGNSAHDLTDGSANLRANVNDNIAAAPVPLAQEVSTSRPVRLNPVELGVMSLASTLALLASYLTWWSISVTEAWGFVTGGICVWLVVRQHMWNWPVGLANNVFFFVLFLQSRLFADMGLQVVYFGLGLYGWFNWLYGGENRTHLRVSRTTRGGRMSFLEPCLAESAWNSYGDRYSELMGAKHICVDQARTAVPISATAIRSDPFGNWNYLEPPVRAWFTKRICVLGAESTGTTTLAKALSETLQTTWVEEFGREYSEIKLARKDSIWRTEEFSMIAREQQRREDAAARHANRVLICDTNAFATTLWHRRYMGSDCADVAQIAKQARCDLYLLTGDEIPFVQDGLRDGEHLRRQMHTWFEDALAQQPVPWRLVRGSHKHRLQSAVQYIQDLFRESAWKPHPQTKALA